MELREYRKFKRELEDEAGAKIAKVLAEATARFEQETGLQVARLDVTLQQMQHLGRSREIDGHMVSDVTVQISSTLEQPRG